MSRLGAIGDTGCALAPGLAAFFQGGVVQVAVIDQQPCRTPLLGLCQVGAELVASSHLHRVHVVGMRPLRKIAESLLCSILVLNAYTSGQTRREEQQMSDDMGLRYPALCPICTTRTPGGHGLAGPRVRLPGTAAQHRRRRLHPARRDGAGRCGDHDGQPAGPQERGTPRPGDVDHLRADRRRGHALPASRGRRRRHPARASRPGLWRAQLRATDLEGQQWWFAQAQ